MEYDYNSTGTERCMTSMKKSGKLTVAFGGILLGVLLIFFGNGRRETSSATSTAPEVPPVATETHSVEEYRLAIETRVANICGEVAGAGGVSVVVTLEGGFEYVYAYDVRAGVGGDSKNYITIGSGDDESLVYLTERAPAITGIGVVCTGGNDETVRREVTNLVAVAFGVSTNKIYVTGRK